MRFACVYFRRVRSVAYEDLPGEMADMRETSIVSNQYVDPPSPTERRAQRIARGVSRIRDVKYSELYRRAAILYLTCRVLFLYNLLSLSANRGKSGL